MARSPPARCALCVECLRLAHQLLDGRPVAKRSRGLIVDKRRRHEGLEEAGVLVVAVQGLMPIKLRFLELPPQQLDLLVLLSTPLAASAFALASSHVATGLARGATLSPTLAARALQRALGAGACAMRLVVLQ